MEITVNTKQAIAFLWTFVAIAFSLIVTLATGWPNTIIGGSAPWWVMIMVFFGVFLLTTLPVYLLIVLWELVAKSGNE